jgi:hypothetical protein
LNFKKGYHIHLHYQNANHSKYLVYLVDYELKLYDGQRQVYTIEYNGLDLLNWISKEKNNLMENTEDITITIERGEFK